MLLLFCNFKFFARGICRLLVFRASQTEEIHIFLHRRPAVVWAACRADPFPRAVDARGRPHHGGVQAQEEGGAGLLPGRHQPHVRGVRGLLGVLAPPRRHHPPPPVPGTRPANKRFIQFLSASVTFLTNPEFEITRFTYLLFWVRGNGCLSWDVSIVPFRLNIQFKWEKNVGFWFVWCLIYQSGSLYQTEVGLMVVSGCTVVTLLDNGSTQRCHHRLSPDRVNTFYPLPARYCHCYSCWQSTCSHCAHASQSEV